MVKINLKISPEENCPRYKECSKNKCPLHKDYDFLEDYKGDDWEFCCPYSKKCTSKRIRRKIGKAFNLRQEGMTNREFKATKRWENMPEDKKKSKIKQLQENSPISRLHKKGYRIAPKSKNKSLNTNENRQNKAEKGSNSTLSGYSRDKNRGKEKNGN